MMDQEINNLLELGEVALTSENPAEAYRLFGRALEVDTENATAWLGKGRAAAWSSTLANIRYAEMEACFKEAFARASQEQRAAVIKSGGLTAAAIGDTIVTMAIRHFQEFGTILDIQQYGLSILRKAAVNRPEEKAYHARIFETVTMLARVNMLCDSYDIYVPEVSAALVQILAGCFVIAGLRNTAASPGHDHIVSVFDDGDRAVAREVLEVYLPLARRGNPSIKDPQVSDDEIHKMLASRRRTCFVATAATGSDTDPSVATLRTFRDAVLLPTVAGRTCIWLYELVGPMGAKHIRDRAWARQIVLHGLVRPSALLAVAVLAKKRR
jgi:hypothetical protein